jgi:hypothetical protein
MLGEESVGWSSPVVNLGLQTTAMYGFPRVKQQAESAPMQAFAVNPPEGC